MSRAINKATRILKELEQMGVIEKFNGHNWMRIENSNSCSGV